MFLFLKHFKQCFQNFWVASREPINQTEKSPRRLNRFKTVIIPAALVLLAILEIWVRNHSDYPTIRFVIPPEFSGRFYIAAPKNTFDFRWPWADSIVEFKIPSDGALKIHDDSIFSRWHRTTVRIDGIDYDDPLKNKEFETSVGPRILISYGSSTADGNIKHNYYWGPLSDAPQIPSMQFSQVHR